MSNTPDDKITFSQESESENSYSQSSQSSHSAPLLFIVLDCLYYVSGEKINGEILVNIPIDYPAGSLQLSSKGLEQVKLPESSVASSNSIYNLQSTVFKWDSKTPFGQYIFPFTFKLPAFCPSTFSFLGKDENNEIISADVVYEIICTLDFPSQPQKNLTHSRHINVRNSKTRGNPHLQWQSVEPILGVCCSTKGSTLFKVTLAREEHAQTNSELLCLLETDNSNCTAAISNIKAQIRMEGEIIINQKAHTITEVFSTNSKEMWISSRSSFVYGKEMEFQCEIGFDEGINPSSNETHLIKCCYYIEFFVKYNAKLRSDVYLKVPFHVNPRQNVVVENPMVPENWTPRESPVYSALIDESISNMTGSSINLYY